MAALFQIPNRTTRIEDDAIAKKSVKKLNKAPTTVKSGGGLFAKIANIKANVELKLGKYKETCETIQDEYTLNKYIDACIENNVVAIDTETTGLDPMLDDIVGFSMHTPGQKSVYIPIAHKSYITLELSENQLQVEVIKNALNRLNKCVKDVVMFNAVFDTRVFSNQVGVNLKCTWDCYLASRLLNENEPKGSAGLKDLHKKYVNDGNGDAFSFGDLFSGVTFDLVPISVAYVYAAPDALFTYELYEFQKQFLTPTDHCCIEHGLQDVAWVFHNIEMPCIEVTASMENNGVSLDYEYNNQLGEKYHSLLEEQKNTVYGIIDKYRLKIDEYKLKHTNNKLSEPINIDSPKQLEILFYDILGYQQVSSKTPRGTGEDVLVAFNDELSKAILDYRGTKKLVTTYIDKLPNCVNKNDGKVHCKFNQYGTDTGRYSSQDPNMQNIPSHNRDIRKMFVASEGNVMMSSDYSQQEPKCLAALCAKGGDMQMYNTFMSGKDLYSEIASKAFNVPYEMCCEFAPDGSKNPIEYKERRSQAKTILLGVLYGRGIESIAEQLDTTYERAKQIKESVFKGFPAIKKFEQDSLNMAKTYGYVTTICGRKRRLPSMIKPDYEVKWIDGAVHDTDPLNFDTVSVDAEVPYNIQTKWLNRIRQAPFSKKRSIFEDANKEGIWIIDNTKDKDTTKVVNARIQGSAADLTKLAMIRLYNNEELKRLGFKLILQVHDEVIAECPEVNAKRCSELLASVMSSAAEEILNMPIKCDVEITKEWYGDTIEL